MSTPDLGEDTAAVSLDGTARQPQRGWALVPLSKRLHRLYALAEAAEREPALFADLAELGVTPAMIAARAREVARELRNEGS